jgi:hypothetical protein
MASVNLKVVILHGEFQKVAESIDPQTIQKCLSLIVDEMLANPQVVAAPAPVVDRETKAITP